MKIQESAYTTSNSNNKTKIRHLRNLVTYLVRDDCMSCRAATRANKDASTPGPGASPGPGAAAVKVGLTCVCSLLLPTMPLAPSIDSFALMMVDGAPLPPPPPPVVLTENASGPGPAANPCASPGPGAEASTVGLVCTINKHRHTYALRTSGNLVS